MNSHKRRMRQLEHKREVERMIQDKKVSSCYRDHASLRFCRLFALFFLSKPGHDRFFDFVLACQR